jgi:hypothetical protein
LQVGEHRLAGTCDGRARKCPFRRAS